MKKIIKRLLILTIMVFVLGSTSPLVSFLGNSSSNQAVYAQPVDPDEQEAAQEEDMEACYDDYQHVTGTDIDIPKNPLRWFICAVGQTLMETVDSVNRLIMRILLFDPTRNRSQAEDFYGDSCNTITDDANCASTAGVDSGGVTRLRQTWGNILTLANILLIVGFLIMVISTALDLGVFSNYTVKKMLPRIILAAIGANLSWGISSILIQTVNFIGIGISDFMTAPFQENINTLITGQGGTAQSTVGGLLVGVIAALMVAIYASGGAILLLIFAVVGSVVGLAFIVILARRIILTLLLVVAPFAFIFWALPGGEGMFKKWWKLFTQMLLLFPITMVLFAAGIIVGSMANSVGTGLGGGTFDEIATLVVALISIVAPYAMIPLAIKFSSGVLGNIANFANDKSKGLVDRSRNAGGWHNKNQIRKAGKELKSSARTDAARRTAMDNIAEGRDLRGRARRGLAGSRLGSTRLGQSALLASEEARARKGMGDEDLEMMRANVGKEQVRRQSAQSEADKARVAGAQLDLARQTLNQPRSDMLNHLTAVATDASAEDHVRRAAINMLSEQKAVGHLEQVQQAATTNEAVRRTWNMGMSENYGTIKAAAPHMVTEVNAGESMADVAAKRIGNLRNASDEQLAGMSREAWQSYLAMDDAGARARFATVSSNDKLKNQITQDTLALF